MFTHKKFWRECVQKKFEDEIEDFSACTPPKIREAARGLTENKLLPTKSKEFYMKTYRGFKDWCQLKQVTKMSENAFLVIFEEKAATRIASTL